VELLWIAVQKRDLPLLTYENMEIWACFFGWKARKAAVLRLSPDVGYLHEENPT
jgi:hypothetical protein